jgi:hypothetical protein
VEEILNYFLEKDLESEPGSAEVVAREPARG